MNGHHPLTAVVRYLLFVLAILTLGDVAHSVDVLDRVVSPNMIQSDANQLPVGSVDRGAPGEPSVRRRGNCIDSCALEYLSRTGRLVTDSEFENGLEKLGLQITVAFRSLEDCVNILNFFGGDVVAIPFTADKYATYPSIGIIFIPPGKSDRIGHVIVIEDRGEGRLEMWDPSSNEPSRFMHYDQLKYPMETVLLVPRNHAQHYYSIVFIATLFAGLLALFGPTVLRRIRSGPHSRAVTAILVIGASLSGCGRTVRSDAPTAAALIEISPLVHDFGLLNPREQQEYATKSFTIYNRGTTPIECRVRPDCSCIVADHGANAITVHPGDKEEFQLKVSLRQKVGSFEQNVSVSVAGAADDNNHESQLLSTQNGLSQLLIQLTGFVQRQPLPLRSMYQFRAIADGTSDGVVQVTYARKSTDPPLTLASAQVIDSIGRSSPSSIDMQLQPHTESNVAGHTSLGAGTVVFESGTPHFTAGAVVGDNCVDEWNIPIKFRARKNEFSLDRRFIKSTLLLKWSCGHAVINDTQCNLLGELMRPIEMPSRFLVGNGVAGTELVGAVPVRINSPAQVDKLKFDHPDQVRLKLDVTSRQLMVTIVEETVGEFNHRVLVTLDGDEVACVALLGRLSAKH